MAHVYSTDGVRLYLESQGAGPAIVFVHEFGGTCRSFDEQVAYFKDQFRCIAFNARGYPPSDVPEAGAYSQDQAASDIGAVLDGLDVDRAHLIGVSMGAAAALQFALRSPDRVLCAVLASIGTGSDLDAEANRRNCEANAANIEAIGMAATAENMGSSPGRRRLKEKNPAAFRKFMENFASISVKGAAYTQRGVQARRAPVYAHEAKLRELRVPVLVMQGGDDEGCRKPSEFLARTIPGARLEVFAQTGHCINSEEPERFNALCREFIAGAGG